MFSLARTMVLKEWPGILEVKTVFVIMLKCSLSFSLSFFHDCSVEFSRGYTTCNEVISLMANELYACVLKCSQF